MLSTFYELPGSREQRVVSSKVIRMMCSSHYMISLLVIKSLAVVFSSNLMLHQEKPSSSPNYTVIKTSSVTELVPVDIRRKTNDVVKVWISKCEQDWLSILHFLCSSNLFLSTSNTICGGPQPVSGSMI